MSVTVNESNISDGYDIYSWLWTPKFWLASGLKWEDLGVAKTHKYTEIDLLYCPLLFAICITVFRRCLERYIFHPMGKNCGLRSSQTQKPVVNLILEGAYRKNYKGSQKEFVALAKHIDWDVRKVERWWRLRQKQNRPTLLNKFAENGWRCTFYSSSVIYGVYILWNEAWIWDLSEMYKGYPTHVPNTSVWFYYMLEMGFYESLLISQFFDVKRKDWWQMCVHHVATLILLSFSWTINHFRIGSFIVLLHDAADVFLEAAKMAHYAKKEKFSIGLLSIFVLVWFVTRLVIFPFWAIYSVHYDLYELMGFAYSHALLEALLILLQCLHIFWTYFIIKVILEALSIGAPKRDSRSSSSDNDSFDVEDSVCENDGSEGGVVQRKK